MSRRVRCGECGSNMYGRATAPKGKLYKYYRCVGYGDHLANITCNVPAFRADHVDATVWGWVRGLMLNPEAMLRGLCEEQANRERATQPLRDRLAVADDLLADNRAQLGRLLDLYLAGDFDQEILAERKTRLEQTIIALERERADLAAQLEAQALTDEQIETIMEFTAKMRRGLEAMEADFNKRRQLVEVLDVGATLAIEDGRKVVHVQCRIRQDTLSILSPSPSPRWCQLWQSQLSITPHPTTALGDWAQAGKTKHPKPVEGRWSFTAVPFDGLRALARGVHS
jgi:hypothetical protein